MIRNETHDAATGTHTVEEIDTDAAEVRLIVDGKTVEQRPMTLDDWQRIAPPPLPAEHTLAVLLAVKGVITEDDAAGVTGRSVDEVRHEALAWGAAAELADAAKPRDARR